MHHTAHHASYAAFGLHLSVKACTHTALGAFLLLMSLGVFSPEQVSTAEKNTGDNDGPVTRQGCEQLVLGHLMS